LIHIYSKLEEYLKKVASYKSDPSTIFLER
jgi:hypothetical protein